MNETHISFYLRTNRIHIFIDALRGIGQPKNICFLLDKSGHTLVITPYPKKDFTSHRVPASVYKGSKGMEVSSLKLCRILAKLHDWDLNASYRAPGTIVPRQEIVVFYLDEAKIIEHDDVFSCNRERTKD